MDWWYETYNIIHWNLCTLRKHDDVIKWKHFPRYWPFVRGIHRSPVNSPHKGQWCGALMFSLIYAWINDWVNNKQSWGWWFETPTCSLWRHCNDCAILGMRWKKLSWVTLWHTNLWYLCDVHTRVIMLHLFYQIICVHVQNFTRGPFYQRGWTLIPGRISNHVPSKVWNAITYTFPNLNGATVGVWEWISNSSHILWGMWLLIHAVIKVKPC